MPRHKPTLRQKLDTALLQLGLDPKNVRLDHFPSLGLRERTPDGGYIPAENDPRHMQWLSIEAHARKTTGRRGTSGTVADGDVHKIHKVRRLAANADAFLRRIKYEPLTAAEERAYRKAEKAFPSGRKMQSRGFQKRRTT